MAKSPQTSYFFTYHMMPRHAKTEKFKRTVPQNEEPFWSENLSEY